MKKRTSILLASVLLALAACGKTPAAGAAQKNEAVLQQNMLMGDAPQEVVQTITQNLQSNYQAQGLKVLSVHKTPIESLYEVVFNGKQIAYTDAQGKFLIAGELIDTVQGKSLTEERQAELNRVDFDALPFEKAIKEVRGNGELKVAVFSDPDCPFCKRLEQEFAKMDNITIYSFMMPIPSLHPNAQRKSEQIWCAADRTQAWTTWMRQGKMPQGGHSSCENPIAETMQLGEQLGFNGTPTLVLPNGKTQSGYSPMPHLEVMIQQNQK